MAKYRQVQTSFWQDGFVLDLTPEERYFYIYLLTNSKTTQCGIYELPKKVAEVETGYTRETVEKYIQRFVEYGKVEYDYKTRELLIKNWGTYNFSKSPKVVSHIKQELQGVKNKEFKQYVLDSLKSLGIANKELYRMANKTEIPTTLADKIFERDEVCVRCSSKENLTIDHIFPKNIGGTNDEKNLRVLCKSCQSSRPTVGSKLEIDLAKDNLKLEDIGIICTSSIGYQQEKEKEKEKEKKELKTLVQIDDFAPDIAPAVKNKPKTEKPNKNPYSNEFEKFWLIYPRKTDKKMAFTKFTSCLRRYDFETIMIGTKGYILDIRRNRTETKYIKHPKTFLNNDSFLDFLEDDTNKASTTTRKPMPAIGQPPQRNEEDTWTNTHDTSSTRKNGSSLL